MDVEQRAKARQMMAEACAAWIDQWDWTAGSIVTGFVVMMETARPDGSLDATWASGNGADVRGEELAELPAWRVEGLARKLIREVYTDEAADD